MALSFRQLTGWRPDGEIRSLQQPQTHPSQSGGA
jgi:hypothetical protein